MSDSTDRVNGGIERAKPRSEGPVKLDDVDRALLAALQDEGRITNVKLAERVGISPAGSHERVRKLERRGVITGYTARISPEAVGAGIHAFVSVSLRAHSKTELDAFCEAIREFPEVIGCWYMSGDADFLLRVMTADMGGFERFVVSRLSSAPNVGRVQSSFCLSSIKDEVSAPIEPAG